MTLAQRLACARDKDPATGVVLAGFWCLWHGIGMALPAPMFPHNPDLFHYVMAMPITEDQWGWSFIAVSGLLFGSIVIQFLIYRMLVAVVTTLVCMPFGLMLICGAWGGGYFTGYGFMGVTVGIAAILSMVQWTSLDARKAKA